MFYQGRRKHFALVRRKVKGVGPGGGGNGRVPLPPPPTPTPFLQHPKMVVLLWLLKNVARVLM